MAGPALAENGKNVTESNLHALFVRNAGQTPPLTALLNHLLINRQLRQTWLPLGPHYYSHTEFCKHL
jgi:hypothetical protein